MNQSLKTALPLLVLTGLVLVVQGQSGQQQPVAQTQQEPRQQVITGRALMQTGVSVTLARPLSSELVFFERLH